jgi:hypothetical protein
MSTSNPGSLENIKNFLLSPSSVESRPIALLSPASGHPKNPVLLKFRSPISASNTAHASSRLSKLPSDNGLTKSKRTQQIPLPASVPASPNIRAQMGEILTKEDLRAKFIKNCYARKILKDLKRNPIKPYDFIKNKPAKHSNPKASFSPQLGMSGITKIVADIKNLHGLKFDSKLVKHLERLAALAVSLQDCTTVTGLLGILYLYVSAITDESISNVALGYLASILDSEFKPQTKEFNTDAKYNKPKWLDILKNLQTNWTLVSHNEGFKKISNVISLCMALGLCDASNIDFRIGGIKVFSSVLEIKHATAVDLLSAAFETIVYFVEGGYACFERGSLKPFLYGNVAIEDFETDYAKAFRCAEYFKSGNLLKFESMEENAYSDLLDKVAEKAHNLQRMTTGLLERNLFARKIDLIRQWQAIFTQARVRGGLRHAPYSIGIFGGTSVGKSAIANILLVTTLKHNGHDASDDKIVVLQDEKFMSNYRSHINGVLVDDIGNTKPAFVERAPTDLIVSLVNNVRMYANMPEAEMKGKVSVEPYVVVMTKNVKDAGATTYSNEPASIARRDRIILTCTVKPQFCYRDTLSEDKVRDAYPPENGPVPKIPDFWDISVERAVPCPNIIEGRAALIEYEPIIFCGKPLTKVSIFEVIRYIGQDSRRFEAAQRELVKNSADLAGKLQICPICDHPTEGVCLCPPPPIGPVRNPSDALRRLISAAPDIDMDTPDIEEDIIIDAESVMSESSHVSDENSHSSFINLHDELLGPTVPFMVTNSGYDPRYEVDEETNPLLIPSPGFQAQFNTYERLARAVMWSTQTIAETEGGAANEECPMAAKANFIRTAWKPLLRYFFNHKIKPVIACLSSTKTSVIGAITMVEKLESKWFKWTNYVPKQFLPRGSVRRSLYWNTKETLELPKLYIFCKGFAFCLLSWLMFMLHNATTAKLFPTWVIVFSFFCAGNFLNTALAIAREVEATKRALYTRLLNERETMPTIFKRYRDNHATTILATSASIAALYTLARVYKTVRSVIKPQGNISPDSMAEINARDAETNPWASVYTTKMPCSEKSITTTPDRLEQMVTENLCHMTITIKKEDGTLRCHECDAFFVKSNVALVPYHMWKGEDLKANFIRRDPTTIGGNFECYLFKKTSVRIPNTDLSLVYVPNGGDWKDLSSYFPLDYYKNAPGRLVYKGKDGNVQTSKLQLTAGEVSNTLQKFEGATYVVNFPTFEGLCMATIITETKGPTIGGFHLGGETGHYKGCCGILIKKQFDEAFDLLGKKEGLILAKSEGEIPTVLYQVQYFQGTSVHRKSPINFLPEGTNCKYYGQVDGRSTYYTDVVPTIITDDVAEICDVPQKWGGPKYKNYPWQASLQHSAHPSCGLEGSLLELATKDFYDGFMEKLREFPDLKKLTRPLSELETICGIDGIRFIDKMKPTTSIGFPLTGAKSNYLTPLDKEEFKTHQNPMVLEQRFWDQARVMEDLYRKGRRAYPVFKACLKDEPTLLTKDKVRVFQSAPIALQLLVRRYYLPIARLLSVLPVHSECAVGINAQGPEWDQLANYVKRYGESRILAGDYSKYDLRMPAQVMFAAFRILIDIAVENGYSKDNVVIMEGIATDVCYPLIAYNGDLIQHIGSNPSGQNLTVYINSIVNALLFRCAYFHLTKHRSKVPKFRDVCALTTYGDDAKSSVHKDYPEFNHIALAEFLAERDMKFTMPDKESTPTLYMEDLDSDLLKRKNVFNEHTNLIMGALDEDSIFKSLHSVLKSKVLTSHQQATENIDGGLREWFHHGREVYETRRAQMMVIAIRADIKHGCVDLFHTYEDKLKIWKDKYQKKEEEEEEYLAVEEIKEEENLAVDE